MTFMILESSANNIIDDEDIELGNSFTYIIRKSRGPKTLNLFNDYFNSVFTKSTCDLSNHNNQSVPSSQLSQISLHITELWEVLSCITPSKAPGCDGINPKIWKICAPSVCIQVTDLFNKILSTSDIPQEWKMHKIIPISKKDNKLNVANYRPISLLCILEKVPTCSI